MVTIIINKYDYKKKEVQDLITHQIGMLIDKASPKRDYLKLRLSIKAKEDEY